MSSGAAIAGTAAAVAGAGRATPLIGWDVLAVPFCGWVWSTVSFPLGAAIIAASINLVSGLAK